MAKKSFFRDLWRDLVSEERRDFKLKIGSTLASSLFGFICGAIVTSLVWYVAIIYIIDALKEIYTR